MAAMKANPRREHQSQKLDRAFQLDRTGSHALYLCICLCVCVFENVFVRFYMYLCVCICICVFLYVFVCFHIYLCVCLCIGRRRHKASIINKSQTRRFFYVFLYSFFVFVYVFEGNRKIN